MTMAAAATTTTFLAAILSRRGSGENFIHDDLAAADPISSKTTDQFKIIGAIKMNFIEPKLQLRRLKKFSSQFSQFYFQEI